MYEKVLGRPEPADKSFEGVRELGVNHLFAKVWTRPGLAIRDRRLITLALLAAQGRTDQLRAHLRGARTGDDPLSREEILEAMVHVAHYAGWAAGASGQSVALSVLSELEGD
jgi:4-carboxymuconolactone decarboxylase